MIRVSEADRVREIVLDRPPLNILTIELLDRLDAVLRQSTEARVTLLRGEGRAFSAGADVKEHLPDQAERMLKALHRVLMALEESGVPSIAAVHGATMGGGLELAMACDLVFAAEDATLGQPEIRLGCIAPFAAAQLPAAVGLKRAMDLMLTGRSVTAGEAAQMGLISGVASLDTARERARALARNSRIALSACRRAVRSGGARRLYLDDVLPSADYVEGLTAFLERREPVWRDR